MAVSYKKLWKLLIDKDMRKLIELCCEIDWEQRISLDIIKGLIYNN